MSRARKRSLRRRWHGPASIPGVLVGLAWSLSQLLGLVDLPGPPWLVWAGAAVGLLLLPFRGWPRHLGTGLLVSLVGYPLVLLSLGVVNPF